MRLLRICILPLLLLSFSCTRNTPPSTAPSRASAGTGLDLERLKLIPVRLQELVDRGAIPGAVSLVARHGEVAQLEAVGYQDIQTKTPMRTDSIFQIMSMTKPFTGVAVMMLVDEGKLELRRTVESYLPEFRNQMVEEKLPNGRVSIHKPARAMTVRDLMCHTSGLGGDPNGALKDNPRKLNTPLAEAVRFYGMQKLEFDPGTKWRYSNMGIATLGRLIEVASGEEYMHFIESRILKPLGMQDTFFFAPKEKRNRIALVHKHMDGRLVHSGDEILAGDSTKFREGAVYPAPEFGLYSTASDLLKFYQMMLNGGSYEGKRYLSQASVETMVQVYTPDVKPSGWLGGTGYGLTWEIVNQPEGMLLLHSMGTFGHGGAFGTEGWIDPTRDLIRVLLVQVSDGSAGPARSAVMQISEAAIVE